MSDEAIIFQFRERVAIKLVCGGCSMFESYRGAYYEAKELCSALNIPIPQVIRDEWKRAYTEQLQKPTNKTKG